MIDPSSRIPFVRSPIQNVLDHSSPHGKQVPRLEPVRLVAMGPIDYPNLDRAESAGKNFLHSGHRLAAVKILHCVGLLIKD